MSDQPRCLTCRHWQPCQDKDRGNDETIVTDGGPLGECRRLPPSRILADSPSSLGEYFGTPLEWPMGGLVRVFPLTYANDWCGEHRPKEAGQ